MTSRTSKQKHAAPSSEQISELTEAVIALTDQVRCLRLAVDEIEQELGWAIRTKVLDRLPPPRFPCDERLWQQPAHDVLQDIEHACDTDQYIPDIVSQRDNFESAELPPRPSHQQRLW
jgi:hypothetical protein